MLATPIHYFIVSITSYLIGSFPTGVVLSKKKYGIDVREMGSGNIGATNVTRVFGWYAGIITLVIDLAKGFFPLYFLKGAYPEDAWLLTLSAFCVVFGHCFSLFLKFRGGKGVATGLGTVLSVSPYCALFGALVYILVIWKTKISALGSLSGILCCLIFVAVTRPEASVSILIVSVSCLVLLQHISNIKKMIESRKG